MDFQTSALVALVVLVLAGIGYSVLDAMEDRERAAELREKDRQVAALVEAAHRTAGRSAEFHDQFLEVRARERAARDSLERERARHAAAADSAEEVAAEIRPRLDANLDELVTVVHPPVQPLARTTRAQVDSALDAQQAAIAQLRGMATSIQGQLASTERELAACVEDVEGCHQARRELQVALDSMTARRDEWRDLATPSVLDQLFGSFGEGALRVVATGGICYWSLEGCAGAVGIQVVEVAF
jgi:DNA repair exonuclease SbcCD ATPase subunit